MSVSRMARRITRGIRRRCFLYMVLLTMASSVAAYTLVHIVSQQESLWMIYMYSMTGLAPNRRPPLPFQSNGGQQNTRNPYAYRNYVEKHLNTPSFQIQLPSGMKESGVPNSSGVHALPLVNISTVNEQITDTVSAQDEKTRSSDTRQTEVHHIGYLKVHKAGSTTVQNLLFRFALSRNLTVVLPLHAHYFSYSNAGHQPVEPLPNGAHYDILACHSVFRADTYLQVLPEDSKFIAVVREPLEQMVSAAYYYRSTYRGRYLRTVPKQTFITSLIRHPEWYDKYSFSITKNMMAHDFGFWDTMDQKEIMAYLSTLNLTMALVLVLEQFEESLVLMKRMFHWEICDIIYTVSNKKRESPQEVAEDDMRLFRKRNYLDVAIYEFFRNELQRKIALAGADLKDEVAHLKSVMMNVSEFCQKRYRSVPQLDIQPSPWNNFCTVSVTDCKLMEKNELAFVDMLRLRHKWLFKGKT